MTAYTDREFLVDILSAALSVPAPPQEAPDAWGEAGRRSEKAHPQAYAA
jgi:hypothetical protein